MNFLQKVIFNNTVESYLIVLVTIILVMFLKTIISRIFLKFLPGYLNPLAKIDDTELKNLLIRPLGWVVVALVSVILIDKLNFPDALVFSVYETSSKIILKRLGSVVIVISIIRFIMGIVDFIGEILAASAHKNKKNEEGVIIFLKDFLKVVLGIMGILWLIKVGFNQKIGPILTGLSIVGAALALAAKESLENIIASFIIFFDKPFFVGDQLKVNTIIGHVEKIGLRSTRIRTRDKTLVTMPNKQMVDSVVDNWSMRTKRKGEFLLDFDNATSNENLNELLNYFNTYLAKKAGVIKHSAFVTDYNKAGVTVCINFVTSNLELDDFNRFRQTIILDFREKVDALKVQFNKSQVLNTAPPENPEPPKSNPII